MSAPVDQALNITLNDPAYRGRLRARDEADKVDALNHGLVVEDIRHKATDAVTQLDRLDRTERSQRIVARMDLGAKAGPDNVLSRLQQFEQTGDLTGQQPAGMSRRKQTDMIEQIRDNDRTLRFFEENPDAVIAAVEDNSLFDLPGHILNWTIDRGEALVGGFQREYYDGGVAAIEGELLSARMDPSFELDPAYVAEQTAEVVRLKKEREKMAPGGTGLTGFDTNTLDTILGVPGQATVMLGRGGVSGIEVGLKAAPIGGVAGTLIGAFGGPVTAVAGAFTGTKVGFRTGFGIGLNRSFYRRMLAPRYEELVKEGWDPNAPETFANAATYAAVGAAIERLTLGLQWRVAGKKLLTLSAPKTAKMLGVGVSQWVKNPTKQAMIRSVFGGQALAALAEGREEILQASLGVAAGNAAARLSAGEEFGLEELLDETFRLALDPATLEEGAIAALGTLVMVGGYAPVTIHKVNKAVAEADKTQEFFDALDDAADVSTLAEKSPRLMGEFLGSITDDTERSTIYIGPEELTEALGQEGISQAEVEKVLPGLTDRIDKAREQGRKVSFSAREFGSKVVNTNLFDRVRPHITNSEKARTPQERIDLQKLAKSEEGLAEALKDEASAELALQSELDASAQVVAQKIADQLVESGRRTKVTAAEEVGGIQLRARAFASHLSEEAGKLITPEEAFALAPLYVLSKEQVKTLGRGQGVEVAEIEPPTPLADEAILNQDYIRSAAIVVDGTAYEGATHSDAYEAAMAAGAFANAGNEQSFEDVEDVTEWFDRISGRYSIEEGFMNDEESFLTREDAAVGRSEDLGLDVEAGLVGDLVEDTGEVELNQDIAPILERVAPPTVAEVAATDEPFLTWRPSKTKAGKLVGVPEGIETDQDWDNLHAFIASLVDEGLVGRRWYEESAEAFLQITDGNFAEAERITQLFAVYSPQANVPVNAQLAVRAYLQWKSGVPEDQFTVSSELKDGKAKDVLYHGKGFKGRKIDSFYHNLVLRLVQLATPEEIESMNIDPEIFERATKHVTADMWVFRAYGYLRDAGTNDFGKGRYSLTENDMNRIAAELNAKLDPGEEAWLPHQVQAAVWTAIKARHEIQRIKDLTNQESLKLGHSIFGTDKNGVESVNKIVRAGGVENELAHRALWRKHALTAQPDEIQNQIDLFGEDFSDVLDRLTFAVTHEAMPAPFFSSAIHVAPMQLREDFQAASHRLIVDEDGHDIAAGLAGVSLNWVIQSRGGYKGALAANMITRLLPNKPADKDGGYDISKEIADLYARMVQYIYKQDAVPWYRADKTIDTKVRTKVVPHFRVVGGLVKSGKNKGKVRSHKNHTSREAADAQVAKLKAKNPKIEYSIEENDVVEKSRGDFFVKNAKGQVVNRFDTEREAAGYVLAQPGRGLNLRVEGDPHSRAVAFRIDRSLNTDMLDGLFEGFRDIFGQGIGFTQTARNEYSIVNYRGENGRPFMMDDERFSDAIHEMENKYADEFGIIDVIDYRVQSDYGPDLEESWEEDPEAEKLFTETSLAGRPDLHAWLRDRRAAFETLLAEFDERAVQLAVAEHNAEQALLLPEEGELAQPAYHGGPVDHDKFSVDFARSGTGGLAEGYGLYFSSLLDIAEHYRKATAHITRPEVLYLGSPTSAIEWRARDVYEAAERGETARAVEIAEDVAAWFVTSDFHQDRDAPEKITSGLIAKYKREQEQLYRLYRQEADLDESERIILQAYDSLDADEFEIEGGERGQVFEVDIPEDSELLDRDAPLSEQPDIIEKLKRNGNTDVLRVVEQAEDALRFNGEDWTGAELYQRLMEVLYDFDDADAATGAKRAASMALLDAGIPGLRYRAGQRSNTDSTATNYVIWDDAAIEIASKLYADKESARRGYIKLKEEKAYIALLEANDQSTFQHELAHWYFNQMAIASKLNLLPAQQRSDLQEILDWLEVDRVEDITLPYADGRLAPNGEVDKPHERFARGHEQYFADGKFPTDNASRIFSVYKRWVLASYGGLVATREALGTPIPDNIRSVYDRMFLINSEIESASNEPLFETPEAMGVDADSTIWKNYQRKWTAAKERAFQRVVKSKIVDARRAFQEDRARLIDDLTAEATEKVDQDPGWAIINLIKRGTLPDGTDVGKIAALDRDSFAIVFGDRAGAMIEALNSRPDQGPGKNLVASKGAPSTDPQWLAEQYDFASVEEMVEAMLTARTVRQLVQEQLNRIEHESDSWSEQSVQEDAEAAAALDEDTLFLEEMRQLRQLIGQEPQDIARRDQAVTGAPAASEADVEITTTEATLEAARKAGADAATVDALQRRVIDAKAAARAAVEGRRAQREAASTVSRIESRLLARTMRIRAREVIEDLDVGDLRRERAAWRATSLREGKKARKAIAARDYGTAASSLERQLLAAAAVTEATQRLDEIERGWKKLSGLTKEKNLSKLRAPGFDGAAQIVKLLARYNMRRGKDAPKPPVVEALDPTTGPLSEFANAVIEETGQILDLPEWIATNEQDRRHWKDLTVAEFLGVVDTVANIAKVSRQEVRDIQEGRAIDLEKAATLVGERIRAANRLRVKSKQSSTRKGLGGLMDAENLRTILKDNWRALDVLLLKVEPFIRFLGGSDITNVVRTHLWEQINQGSENYIEDHQKYALKFAEIMGRFDQKRMRVKHRISNTSETPTIWHYEAVLMASHLGTVSNYSRLYDGFANAQDRNWDKAAIDAALASLNDEEWGLVQEIWDAFEEMRPRVSDHHFQMTGKRMDVLERREFISPTGRLMKGGYMPAAYDPRLDDFQRKIQEEANIKGIFGHSYALSEVKHGHTEGRREGYSAPLSLDPGVISNHIDSVLYDIHMRKPVIDTIRILKRPEVKSAIHDTFGPEYNDMLNKYVHSVAEHGFGQPGASTAWRKAYAVSNYLKNVVVVSGLGFRIATGLLQLTGLAPVMVELGPKYGLAALAKVLGHGVWPSIRETRKRSKTLAQRGVTKDRELREMANSIKGDSRVDQWLQTNQFMFIIMGDAVVSTIAWEGAVMRGLATHGDLKRAEREGDAAIRDTQGAGDIKDLSDIMRGKGLEKWITLFGSFASNLYGRERLAARRLTGRQANFDDTQGKPVREAVPFQALAAIFTEVFMTGAIEALFRGEEPEDDDNLPWWFVRKGLTFGAMPFPVANDLLTGAVEQDARVFLGRSPTTRIFDTTFSSIDEIVDVTTGEEEFDPEKAIRLGLLMLQPIKRYPTSQPEIWVDNFGEDQSLENPRDLIWRKPRERR